MLPKPFKCLFQIFMVTLSIFLGGGVFLKRSPVPLPSPVLVPPKNPPTISLQSYNSILWKFEDGREVDFRTKKFVGESNLIYKNIFQHNHNNSTPPPPFEIIEAMCNASYVTRWSTNLNLFNASTLSDRRRERWWLNPMGESEYRDGGMSVVPHILFNFSTTNGGYFSCEEVEGSRLRSRINIYIEDSTTFALVKNEFLDFSKNDQVPLVVPCTASDLTKMPNLYYGFWTDERTNQMTYRLENNVDYDPRRGIIVRERPHDLANISAITCALPDLPVSDSGNVKFNENCSQTFFLVKQLLWSHKFVIEGQDEQMPFPGKTCQRFNATSGAFMHYEQDFLRDVPCSDGEDCDFRNRGDYTLYWKDKSRSGSVACEGNVSSGYPRIQDYFFTGLDNRLYLTTDSIPPEAMMQLNNFDEDNLFTNQTLTFTCNSSNFLLSPNIKFYVKYVESSDPVLLSQISVEDNDDTECPLGSGKCSRSMNLTLHTNMTEILCKSLWYNSTQTWFTISKKLVVQAGQRPSIAKIGKEHKMPKTFLDCSVTADPSANISWRFPNLESERQLKPTWTRGRSTITIQETSKTFEGKYTCVAINMYGQDTHEFTVEGPGIPALTEKLGMAASGLVGLIFIGASIKFWKKNQQYKKLQRNLSRAEISEFKDGSLAQAEKFNDGSLKATYIPFNMVIDQSELIIARDSILGQGEFGRVYRGFLEGVAVAVKTTRAKADIVSTKMFLTELKIMAYIGTHPHIIRFFGAEITNLEKRIVYGCFELSPFGNLEAYLENNRTQFLNLVKRVGQVAKNSLTKTMIYWCSQIADGMEHLERLKIIHGDLAARNILMFKDDVVKINDFGLSRRLHNYAVIYKKRMDENANIPLPAAWMALESLKNFEFSTRSDVWSFSVTMWEIFSIGQWPFPNCSWQDVIKFWETGQHLSKPTFATQLIYDQMIKCWTDLPANRPSFVELKTFFQDETLTSAIICQTNGPSSQGSSSSSCVQPEPMSTSNYAQWPILDGKECTQMFLEDNV